MEKKYTLGLISILIPTRERPNNIKRVVSSALLNAKYPNLIEFLFYVDNDDKSFPPDLQHPNIKIIYGPRVWLSIMQNTLYIHSVGEIVMYAGDDIEFCSQYWDDQVREEFLKVKDKIILVYGNDLGSYGSKIAILGFLHRNWIEAIGSFSAPSRLSLSDLWHTENARKLNRLVYLPNLHIKHIHYRQGNKEAIYDETYKTANASSRSWAPIITYKKLKRERRIDRILLTEVMEYPTKIENWYFLGELVAKYKNKIGLGSLDARRLRTVNNLEIIQLITRNLIQRILRQK